MKTSYPVIAYSFRSPLVKLNVCFLAEGRFLYSSCPSDSDYIPKDTRIKGKQAHQRHWCSIIVFARICLVFPLHTYASDRRSKRLSMVAWYTLFSCTLLTKSKSTRSNFDQSMHKSYSDAVGASRTYLLEEREYI